MARPIGQPPELYRGAKTAPREYNVERMRDDPAPHIVYDSSELLVIPVDCTTAVPINVPQPFSLAKRIELVCGIKIHGSENGFLGVKPPAPYNTAIDFWASKGDLKTGVFSMSDAKAVPYQTNIPIARASVDIIMAELKEPIMLPWAIKPIWTDLSACSLMITDATLPVGTRWCFGVEIFYAAE